jgi:multiple sugar transport system substrate-binding protein
MKAKLIIIVLLFVVLTTSGFGCKGVDKKTQEAMQPVTLNYWRVWDGPDAFEDIIAAYNKIHPYVTIEYRKLRYSEYEKELLNALAEDRAPDIISIHNTWIKKYQSKIEPMPDKITMAYPVVKGKLKKEVFYELRTVKSLTLKEIKNNFIDLVYDDVVLIGKDKKTKKTRPMVFGLPLSVDTLVMYYNKDLFNNAGIINPPEYWNKEFQQGVKQLTKIDAQGNIIQSGVALGGSSNIERYSDILSILMMQNGAEMLSDSGQVMFAAIPTIYKEQKFNPGMEALRFYTDFANPTKEVYSWNAQLDNSVNMFTQGKLAMMFGYAYHLPIIKKRGPKINFAIAPLPQIEGSLQKVNYANYWVETVLKKSKHPEIAWDFVQFAARAENVKSYLQKTKKPTALRSLIKEQLEDEELDVFAGQLLTAKSWYKGKDSNAMEEIFKEMIDSVNANPEKIQNAISLAASKVQQTIK